MGTFEGSDPEETTGVLGDGRVGGGDDSGSGPQVEGEGVSCELCMSRHTTRPPVTVSARASVT